MLAWNLHPSGFLRGLFRNVPSSRLFLARGPCVFSNKQAYVKVIACTHFNARSLCGRGLATCGPSGDFSQVASAN